MRPDRAALLAELPHAQGVYVLRGVRGRPLYVGASDDVRSRAASHLGDRRGRHPGRDEMAERVRAVSWVPTGSRLETLLLEARLIREWLPPYNRSIRNFDRYAYLRVTDEPFPRLRVKSTADAGRTYGPWRKQHGARRAAWALRRAFGLRSCRRDFRQGTLFAVCDRPGASRCAGPCDPERDPAEYDRRVEGVRAFLAGRERGAADEVEDEEVRETLDQAFSMLSRLREAVDGPDEILRLPSEEPERRKLLLVRAGRPFGPYPLPAGSVPLRRLLVRLRRTPRPDPAEPLPKPVVDDVKILAAHRDVIPDHDRFPVDAGPADILAG